MALHVSLLREVSIWDDAAEASDRRALAGLQAGAVFAHLVLAGERGLTRDQLADTIWGEDLPRTWPSALRGIVSRVRAFVEPLSGADADHPLVTGRGGRYVLRLPPDTAVDVREAERDIESVRGVRNIGAESHGKHVR